MATTVQPFLMFQGSNAEEAMKFYVSLFPESEIVNVTRYGASGPGPEGTVMKGVFKIAGQTVLCTDSWVKHEFGFTPSFSMFVTCDSEGQIGTAFAKLSENGAVLMPLDNYGFSRKFGWVSDRFGVSWQLSVE